MEVSGRQIDRGFDSSNQVLCDLCILLSKTEHAEHYCTDCNDYFCDNCFSMHKVSRLSNTHTFLSKEEMPRQRLLSPDENICTKHRGKVNEYFCRVHNNFFCAVCATLGHKECTVDYIDDIATDFDQMPEYKSLMDKIFTLTQLLQNLKILADNNRQDIQTIHEEYRSDVKKFRVEINNLLDSMENKSLTEAQRVKEADIRTAESASTTYESTMTDIEGIVSDLENKKRYKQKRQLVISTKKAQIRINEYENKTNDLSSRNTIRHYKFQPNYYIIQSILSAGGFGRLNHRKNEVRRRGMEKTEIRKASVTHDPKSVRATCLGQINVSHSDDNYTRGCWITGCVTVGENRIVVVDNNNNSVKLVDIKKDVIASYIRLPTPWGITCIDENQVVVSCLNKIVFLTVDGALSVNKEVKTDGKCRGIVYGDNKVIVSIVEPEPVIKVITLNGEILQTISQDTTGQPLFQWPQNITLSYDMSTLFVSDRDRNRVTSLNLRGEVRHVYTHNKLKDPRGLTADRHGNIYIAGFETNNIHQISTLGTPIQILLSDTQGMERPNSVAYSEIDNRLYVSHDFEFTNSRNKFLTIYQLQYETQTIYTKM